MIMSHMFADDLEELHTLAQAIGLKREWFQTNSSVPHYDVCQTKRALAIEQGAIELPLGPQWKEVYHRLKGQYRQ